MSAEVDNYSTWRLIKLWAQADTLVVALDASLRALAATMPEDGFHATATARVYGAGITALRNALALRAELMGRIQRGTMGQSA